jgi:hypothetical protein
MCRMFFPAFLCVAPNEIVNEYRNIFRPLAKRRNGDRKSIEPIEKILAECSGSDGGRQIPIRCCNEPDIYRNRTIAANPLEFAFLEHAQQRNLRFHRKIANFIEEQCPPLRRFKSPHSPLHRTREYAFFMPNNPRRQSAIEEWPRSSSERRLSSNGSIACEARAQ